MKLDYKTPHMRIVTYKEVNGIMEKTFVLTPIKAKEKPVRVRPTEKKPYVPLGTCKSFPKQEETERDEHGNIIPYAMWSEMALEVLAEHRRIKQDYDEATTETITLSNGFKKKIHHKLEFPDRSMKPLTSQQRAGLVAKHRFVKNTIKNAKKKENARNYPLKPFEAKLFNKEAYAFTRAKRWIKSNKLEAIHESRIQAILSCRKIKAVIEIVNERPGGIQSIVSKTIPVNGTEKQSLKMTKNLSKTAAGARLVLPKSSTYIHNFDHRSAA